MATPAHFLLCALLLLENGDFRPTTTTTATAKRTLVDFMASWRDARGRQTHLPVIGRSTKVKSLDYNGIQGEIVKAHSDARGNVTPPASIMKPLAWSGELATLAAAHADACVYRRTNESERTVAVGGAEQLIGENQFISSFWGAYDQHGTRKDLKPVQVFARAFAQWLKEKDWYSIESDSGDENECRGQLVNSWCGNYKQIVYATSTMVGCGGAMCSNVKLQYRAGVPLIVARAVYTVCYYAPSVDDETLMTTTPFKPGACAPSASNICSDAPTTTTGPLPTPPIEPTPPSEADFEKKQKKEFEEKAGGERLGVEVFRVAALAFLAVYLV